MEVASGPHSSGGRIGFFFASSNILSLLESPASLALSLQYATSDVAKYVRKAMDMMIVSISEHVRQV